MRRTLLIVFVHGFKGDDNTFLGFPTHLAAVVGDALPNITVSTAVYPRYETRGDLASSVARFREWLTNQVIDAEVALGTPSPMVHPGVRVIVVGHSMGGIVAAEALLGSAYQEEVVGVGSKDAELSEPGLPSAQENPETTTLMFPYIQGLIAFDTPYLGISPGVVAHGAEGHWNTGKALLETATGLFGVGTAAGAAGKAAKAGQNESIAADASKSLPAPPTAEQSNKPAWQRWGRYAMVAGAASAVAAGAGAAAYTQRSRISEGWSWVGSHLQFVGCLARGEELKRRLAAVMAVGRANGVGFANIYTCLGAGAAEAKTDWSSQALGAERTFCNLPKTDAKSFFLKATNDKARDEATAHMYMFSPEENPGYYNMAQLARNIVLDSMDKEWYGAATKPEESGLESMAID